MAGVEHNGRECSRRVGRAPVIHAVDAHSARLARARLPAHKNADAALFAKALRCALRYGVSGIFAN